MSLLDKVMAWILRPYVAQEAVHALIGYGTVITFAYFWKPLDGFLTVAVFAALKEFAFDAIVEHADFENNAADFAFYMSGALAALAVAML